MTTEDFLRRQIIPLAYRQLSAGELLTRAAAGDAEAFVAIVCSKYSFVHGICRQTLGPEGPAEDVAAEVFVQLWRQRKEVRDPQAVDAWLMKTARNLANKLVAAQTRGRAAGLEWVQRIDAAEKSKPPDRAAIQEEMVRRVRQALAEQTDADQRLLWTAEHSGGDAHAAETLGLSVATYRVRLHRARQRLRALLKKYGMAPMVGAIGMLGSGKNRAATALAKLWGTTAGKVLVVGVSLCSAAVIVSLVLTREARQSIKEVAHARRSLAQKSPIDVGTLQDRNRRFVQDRLVEQLRELIQPFYKDYRIELVEIRAFGSEVEVEFKTDRPPSVDSGLAERLRGRFCTFRRRYVVFAQPPDSDRWYSMKSAKPVSIEVPLPPLGVSVEVVTGKSEYAAAERLFRTMPHDPSAEAEQIRYLFGAPGGKLRLPAGGNGLASSSGRMWFVDGDMAMYERNPKGQWSYVGDCPGWWLLAHDGQLYCTTGDDILTRPFDAPNGSWVLWKKIPEMQSGESGGFLAVVGDRFYFAVQPVVHCHCPVANPKEPWVRQGVNVPLWPNGIAGTADRFFGHNATHLLTRPSRDASAPWTPLATWPKGCAFLVVDGDRLLAYGGPGPIYARPLAADSTVDWEVVGEAHEPPRELPENRKD